MRIYTAHLHPRRAPVLVREGFSWGGLFFAPLWLLRHRAWVPAAIAAAALVAICTAAPPPARPLLAFAVFVLTGAVGQDLRRWSLERRRYQLAHVVAAHNRDEAFLRLLSVRGDQVPLAA